MEQEMVELDVYYEQKKRIEQQINKIASLVASLKIAKEAVLAACVEALLDDRSFDISALADLDNRLLVARCAADVLRRREIQNQRCGPLKTFSGGRGMAQY